MGTKNNPGKIDTNPFRDKAAQVRALIAMGIPHWVRPDGYPVVHEADARPWAKQQVRREEEPDYAALRG